MLRRPEPAAASSAWTAGSKKGVHENTAAVIPVRKSSGGVVFRVSAPGYSRKTIFEVSRPFGAGDFGRVAQRDGIEQTMRGGQVEAAEEGGSVGRIEEAGNAAQAACPESHRVGREHHVAAPQAAIDLREVVAFRAGHEEDDRSPVGCRAGCCGSLFAPV